MSAADRQSKKEPEIAGNFERITASRMPAERITQAVSRKSAVSDKAVVRRERCHSISHPKPAAKTERFACTYARARPAEFGRNLFLAEQFHPLLFGSQHIGVFHSPGN